MKLRYYMRGLGIGILVTAILMGVTMNGKTEKLSDAEIIERAKALGMEEKYKSTVLADTLSENEAEDKKVYDEKAEVPETEEITPQEIENDVTDEPEEDVLEESIQESIQEEQTQITEIKETVQITVHGGDGSQTVARKLLEVGLIENAQSYDRYLCSNGYDKRICAGTHTIPIGASEEEIAKIITSRQ